MSMLRVSRGVPRRSFGKTKEVLSLPNLIEAQSRSFNDFVQLDCLSDRRQNIGLEKVLRNIFPIEHGNRMSLDYMGYELGEWQCICGAMTGIEKRYTWKSKDGKKTGVSKLSAEDLEKGKCAYVRCSVCHSRVSIKFPMTPEECRYNGRTYALPLKVKLQLTSWDHNEATGERSMRDIKEQSVFMCLLPVMLDCWEDTDGLLKLGNRGTFLINGVDRVVVSQIHRAPGVLFFTGKKSRGVSYGSHYSARIIPARGAWLDFEFDSSGLLYVKVDKKKKLLVSVFLQALGVSRDKMMTKFYDSWNLFVKDGNLALQADSQIVGRRLDMDLVSADGSKTFAKGIRFSEENLKDLGSTKGAKYLFLGKAQGAIGRFSCGYLEDPITGEMLLEPGTMLDEGKIERLQQLKNSEPFQVTASLGGLSQPSIALCLAHDSAMSYENAVREFYYRIRPGDAPAMQVMIEYINAMFYNARYYDLTVVGRLRINRKLGLNSDLENTVLTLEDIVAVIKYLVGLQERGEGEADDVDNLSNRCVRLVDDLLQTQVYLGFYRIEKIAREKLRLEENGGSKMPYDFINVKPLSAVLGAFFGTGQLSQFLDQTNPLSEMAHKRVLSALGPGGITRDNASLDVRDVHTSHYGRICPIASPDGHNIGLISSLATYAKINKMGFIETVYRPVINGVVQDRIESLDAYAERGKAIAQAAIKLDENGKILEDQVFARYQGDIIQVKPTELDCIDASPRQMVSIATALIPFLENDDANRALMGSNMQRQAVPLIKPLPPIVGTGVEREIGKAAGAVIVAKSSGVVKYVSADKIIVEVSREGQSLEVWTSKPLDVYELKTFGKSSFNTWLHFSPIVKQGDIVEKGDVLTNGPAVINGELALGNDICVAYMVWYGYNFEDAIVISKRLVSDDLFTSVHIEEFVVEARDTKLGAEEITRDIPGLSETDLRNLDEDGVVKIGTRVSPGDILVAKATLKGDSQVSPEEKLLRAIFGDKSREVRDTSSRVPPGINGTVVDVKVFSRSGIRKDKRYKEVAKREADKIERNFQIQQDLLARTFADQLVETCINGGLELSDELRKTTFEELVKFSQSQPNLKKDVAQLVGFYQDRIKVLTALKEDAIVKLRKGDELPSGVLKVVRVYVAMKRPINVGDKMAGRHGNKGVVSKIVDIEDMPYLADGRPVDIVLNPLGVPGRMNLGQVLETVLGMACQTVSDNLRAKINDMSVKAVKDYLLKYLGKEVTDHIYQTSGEEGIWDAARTIASKGLSVSVPVFDGVKFEDDVVPLLKDLGLSEIGEYDLYNGMTGEKYMQSVTVGYIYMMKLIHMVDDKLHARSVGPYSLITQQPLGGKAQFGGQRLGEMEVWALFAYGAAYALQELLTIKSDDINGRTKAYEAIVRGEEIPAPGLPESFNVLIKELQSLGLSLDLFKASEEQFGE